MLKRGKIYAELVVADEDSEVVDVDVAVLVRLELSDELKLAEELVTTELEAAEEVVVELTETVGAYFT